MGRGRAKAKQTKVARELKYRSVDTDFASLQRELRSGTSSYGGVGDHQEPVEDDYDIDDDYADLAARYGYVDEAERLTP